MSKLNALLAQRQAAPKPAPEPAPLQIRNDVADWPELAAQAPANTGDISAHLQRIRDAIGTDNITDVLNDTLRFLKENPAVADILLPEHIGTLVEALRQAHGVVLAQKQTRASNRKTKSSKITDLANDLANLGFPVA